RSSAAAFEIQHLPPNPPPLPSCRFQGNGICSTSPKRTTVLCCPQRLHYNSPGDFQAHLLNNSKLRGHRGYSVGGKALQAELSQAEAGRGGHSYAPTLPVHPRCEKQRKRSGLKGSAYTP